MSARQTSLCPINHRSQAIGNRGIKTPSTAAPDELKARSRAKTTALLGGLRPRRAARGSTEMNGSRKLSPDRKSDDRDMTIWTPFPGTRGNDRKGTYVIPTDFFPILCY